MTLLIARSITSSLLATCIAGCAVLAQSQTTEQNSNAVVPLDAPAIARMVVGTDGTLHFGPRTVPLPAPASPEARSAYTRYMLQQAQISVARGGMASEQSNEAYPAPARGWSKEAALNL